MIWHGYRVDITPLLGLGGRKEGSRSWFGWFGGRQTEVGRADVQKMSPQKHEHPKVPIYPVWQMSSRFWRKLQCQHARGAAL